MLTIYDFISLLTDDNPLVRVYDISDEVVPTLYEGYFDEMPDELQEATISSIDTPYADFDGYIGINVDKN